MTGLSLNKKIIAIILIIISSIFDIEADNKKNLIILHLNDTHSQMDPISSHSDNNPNRGGAIRQNAVIEELRQLDPDILLFHSGDFVQGTPYFNIFKGQAEIAIMNLMQYDAICLGNHEFDYGLENLAKMIKAASFPVITTNLDFTNTVLDNLTHKYFIIHKKNIKIGIIGLTINIKGLTSSANYSGIKLLDPIETANETAEYLKEKEKCDMIICLSHLGYDPTENKKEDVFLAKNSRNIDIILGGHTHTFLNKADRRYNLDGKEVVINQVGNKGIYIGRLDVILEN